MIDEKDIEEARAAIAAGMAAEFVTHQWPVKREVHGCIANPIPKSDSEPDCCKRA